MPLFLLSAFFNKRIYETFALREGESNTHVTKVKEALKDSLKNKNIINICENNDKHISSLQGL